MYLHILIELLIMTAMVFVLRSMYSDRHEFGSENLFQQIRIIGISALFIIVLILLSISIIMKLYDALMH